MQHPLTLFVNVVSLHCRQRFFRTYRPGAEGQARFGAKEASQPMDTPGRTGDRPAVSRFKARRAVADTASVGERDRLTRDMIFTIALEIVDCEGADALSMRRLAQRLRRDPMALYRHAAVIEAGQGQEVRSPEVVSGEDVHRVTGSTSEAARLGLSDSVPADRSQCLP